MLAISGHFAGNLSAKLIDGSVATILNSNTAPGELPDPADQFHAAGGGSQHTGVDDGFVIKASATTGQAKWIKHYPESNRDAQVVGVDVDASGNVFGSGYSCSIMVKAPSRERHSLPTSGGTVGFWGLRTLEERLCRSAPCGRLPARHQPRPARHHAASSKVADSEALTIQVLPGDQRHGQGVPRIRRQVRLGRRRP